MAHQEKEVEEFDVTETSRYVRGWGSPRESQQDRQLEYCYLLRFYRYSLTSLLF